MGELRGGEREVDAGDAGRVGNVYGLGIERGGRRGEGNVMGAIWVAGFGADRVLELVDGLVLGFMGNGVGGGVWVGGEAAGGFGIIA